MSRRGSGPVVSGNHTGQGAGSSKCLPSRIHRMSKLGAAVLAATPRYVFGTVIAVSVSMTAAQAVTFGHSRIVSSLGQPLQLEIPVTQLSQQEIESLRASPAPAQAWQAAGMTPPVALDSMRLVLLDGYRPDVKVIRLSSSQIFDQSIVDVLLDVSSASGQQRYQVSLLAHADTQSVQRAVDSTRDPRAIDGRGTLAQPGADTFEGRQIQVRAGDNMFAIARRNAVQGVSVYQMMMALQQANAQAFIADNVNLVKAGATLTMPGMDALTALSDREARRIFQQHAQAFARYGQGGSGGDAVMVSTMDGAAEGGVADTFSSATAANASSADAGRGDRLRLSGGAQAGASGQAAGSALSDHNPAGSGLGQGGTGLAAGGGGLAGTGAQDVAAALNGPGVNLLASSNVIASDAVADKGPLAVSSDTLAGGGSAFGSDAASGGTVLEAGNGRAHPDDQAAMQKGMDESRTRILELEDNVRHLNEALQKQGHVAAEAALEGARSVSEAIKEVMSIIDPDDADTAAASAADGQPDSASAAVGGGAAGVAGSSNSVGAAQGSSRASNAATATGRADSGSQSTSPVRAEKNVSWLQENMLAVLGGGLALLVLIVVWVLRRVGADKRDVFESDSPITDSMVRDKLRDIDLDLEHPTPGGSGPRS